MTQATTTSPKNAVVLAGGAARGAYEVGVLDYIMSEVATTLGRPPSLDVLCGTSVGAINACVVAAHLADLEACRRILLGEWQGLRLEEIVRANTGELVRVFGALVGRRGASVPPPARRGGFLDPRGVEGIVTRAVSFPLIEENLASGRLLGLTLSTTHLVSGRTVIFVGQGAHARPRWSRDPTITVRPTAIKSHHALASAALPLMFPAVHIDGDFYCDGGLRQNVPLSPARRLGADGLIVINPRFVQKALPLPEDEPPRSRRDEAAPPSPLFVLGKALNALLLDRIDNDLDRLQRINAILDAGTRRFGSAFIEGVNQELGQSGAASGVRSLRVVHVRASENIGKMAASYVQSVEFSRRASGLVGRLLRRIGEWDDTGEADLLSYLLFDGAFATQLVELGRRDARARHDELCAFFSP
jgi:NTE family protein